MKMTKRKIGIGLPVIPTKLDLTDKRQGFLALLAGLLLAIAGSLIMPSVISPTAWVNTMIVLGLIVGLLNIFHKEALTFLIVALSAAFMLSVLASAEVFSTALMQLSANVAQLLASASIVIVIKVVYALTQ